MKFILSISGIKKVGEIFEPQVVTPEGVRIKRSQVDDFNEINVNEIHKFRDINFQKL